jgi:hypothetical protein
MRYAPELCTQLRFGLGWDTQRVGASEPTAEAGSDLGRCIYINLIVNSVKPVSIVANYEVSNASLRQTIATK